MGQRSAVWPLVYINLDRDVQRRERMEALLSELPFPHTRLPGVLWSALSPQEQARLYSPSLNARQFFRPLVDGEKGCYASHLRACEHLLAIQAPALIVLEDDVALDTCLVEVLDALAARSAGNWDVVKLYSRNRERAIEECVLTSSHRLVTYKRVPSMCNGYILSRSGAHKLLQNRRPFGRPVDVDMRYWWECDLRVLGVVPAVVMMGPSSVKSSIWSADRPHRTWTQRWRRWGLQLDYSVRNAWHRRLQDPPAADRSA
jgi:glycosyl transferase family 25